jgi:pimeloyl-ACP methyl ester carboxylesterase
MRTVKYDELIQAARKAYDEKRLNAFYMGYGGPIGCIYSRKWPDGVMGVCAIGAALTPEELENLRTIDYNDGVSARGLVEREFIQFEKVEDAMRLQQAHDAWANQCRRVGDGREDEKKIENDFHNDFRKVIGLEPLEF